MAAIGTRIEVKKLFFDRVAVLKAIRKDELRYYARAGALGMKIMRQSIRAHPKRKPVDRAGKTHEAYVAALVEQQRKRASKPGQPPRGRVFRKSIYFAAILPGPGVVIGPIAFNKRRSPMVPRLLEEGGPVEFTVYRGRSAPPLRGRSTIEPRPFKAPALRKLIPSLPKLRQQANSMR